MEKGWRAEDPASPAGSSSSAGSAGGAASGGGGGGGCDAPKCLAWLRSGRRPYLAAVLALLVVNLAALVVGPTLYRGGQNAFRALIYTYDPMLFGRNEATFPAPRCCSGASCIPSGRAPRAAVFTYIRSEDYMPLLQQLVCTFRRSNPGVELGVMLVAGELGADSLRWMADRKLTMVEVPPLNYPNHFNPRYGRNWLKLRALNMTQYDAVLLVDSDVVVLGGVTPLFSLPVEFAASWDQSRWLGRFNTKLKGINGGVLLMRPCPAAQQHMMQLLESHPKLRFSYGAAEQDFFTWYYRYTGMMLPLQYNTMASDSLHGNLTIGGHEPVIVHFTQNKPFKGAQAGKPGHQFLCSPEELLLL